MKRYRVEPIDYNHDAHQAISLRYFNSRELAEAAAARWLTLVAPSFYAAAIIRELATRK